MKHRDELKMEMWVKWAAMPEFVRKYKENGVYFRVEVLESKSEWCRVCCYCPGRERGFA